MLDDLRLANAARPRRLAVDDDRHPGADRLDQAVHRELQQARELTPAGETERRQAAYEISVRASTPGEVASSAKVSMRADPLGEPSRVDTLVVVQRDAAEEIPI